ncbi:MAG TPA: DUF262 domain-containing protein [Pyrinomonadaceae bacterium]|nr:DUF262 domain-containing protein [Pyrinomonadaceae bacterium]
MNNEEMDVDDESETSNDEVLEDNKEIVEDIDPFDASKVVVFSRDWTIETVYSQIKEGNIDLNPKFQRRNAWNDSKRSILIESVILGYPVPEIVLAEDPKKKRSFIVIDGKQRLLTLAGFIDPETYEYWVNPTLDLKKAPLRGASYKDFEGNPDLADKFREFKNSSIRTTVITNFEKDDVLYDIFYRLNSGATPLSTQELRQVLNKGEFANYLIEITNETQPLHHILKLNGPDKRLVDIEIILRCIAMILFGNEYTGNLKKFLDSKMRFINDNWSEMHENISDVYIQVNRAIEILKTVFEDYSKIGRKYKNGIPEPRFNRVLFEVMVFYFTRLLTVDLTANNIAKFTHAFVALCDEPDFKSSIESSTKNIENYRIRFNKFQAIVNESFGKNFDLVPFNQN